MDLPDDDLSTSSALVVDGNPTSRSILVSQLRDFGMGTVVQSARLTDARRQLEYRKFDVVLCEHHFSGEASSGQDLLDDLRRNQLLPFSTVFIMVTGEATYTKVAEAAESALDGYLLKPHKATQLGERLRQARIRKASLLEIFTAIEAQDFETAANLCLKRFITRGKFWLYAARVGAELLLRVGKYDQAQKLYQAVVDAKTLPWAKLGIARALLDEGQTAKAVSTLENLIREDPGFTDAYDVMGRAQFEQGRFDAALQTYKLASTLTPSSITRMQNLGMMSYFAGNLQQAEQYLDRTVRMGLDSKMFDCQTLVLLAFVRLGNGDSKGLQRCRDDFVKLLERHQDSERHRRLASMVDALHLIAQRQYAQVLQVVRDLCSHVKDPAFDYESASNLVSLLSLLANKAIQLEEVDAAIDAVGLRFAGTRALAELLAGAAHAHAPYADRLRAAHAQILKLAENAMTLSLAGDPKAAVNNLVRHGTSTLSGKLIETAYLVLHRYADKMHDVHDLAEHVHTLRSRYSTHITRASLGEQKRQPGGLTLRVDTTAGKRDAPFSLAS
ncbi:MAG: tetratricopeptide repeat protein [Rhodoferax sp.]|jgi:tetratricopeptide (TPR) repeat protein|uniref:tetratricopeptide repeat protein n=1 Tax=Rhodoferax sp. TaxID=50421 RepID=UPI001B4EDC4A|nr:tetratricopeptide repeat protein [Rhodoferax sp.]MBP8285579.1 tetratricopeptide repeat protein [Rhodoferax sp.]MBP9148296.1 tetratricopeptide repeat protein [Rhodoferax sp.]MBP9737291.1 tetratricopeptide repeat protein [Rhodoferax sp.]